MRHRKHAMASAMNVRKIGVRKMIGCVRLEAEEKTTGIEPGEAMEIQAEIQPGQAREVGLHVLHSPDGREL